MQERWERGLLSAGVSGPNKRGLRSRRAPQHVTQEQWERSCGEGHESQPREGGWSAARNHKTSRVHGNSTDEEYMKDVAGFDHMKSKR